MALIFGACEKPEELWELPPAGTETVSSVNMGPAYDNAVFFSLKTGAAEIRNTYSWHLGFATGSSDNHIVMNGGNEVQLHQTGDTTFAQTMDPRKISNWLWDNPNGKPDSTAFAGWCDSASGLSRNMVYVIDLGSKATVRYKKIKILAVTASAFLIRYADIDGGNEKAVEVAKNAGANFTYFNLVTNKPVAFEPENFSWDLVFMRYRHVYYDMEPITPYYVNGALINTQSVQVKETKEFAFELIDLAKASDIILTHKADEIGYDWKFFDLNGTGKYVVDSRKVFIIKDKEGYLYKLKFIDFYDETGAKGVPKFAYQRL
jgi:hypothetical protein